MTERSRAWLDCETTGLHADRRAYEVALILRQPDRRDTERSWFIDIEDCDMANAEPIALDVGRFWQRHPQAHLVPLVGTLADVKPDLPQTPPDAQVFREVEVLKVVAELTGGRAYVMGSNPSFDTHTLAARMSVYGITPDWHYHPIDVPDRAAGWLAGQGREVPTNEKGDEKSDLIAKACGVDPADYERHSALGDCRLFRDLFDVIQKPSTGDDMYEAAYFGVQKVLDRVIGEGWNDGEGAGIVADVALLAQRYTDLRSRVLAGGWPLVVEEVEAAELREAS